MRYPSERLDQTHQRIVEAASKRFRREGIDAVGVASLMKTTGLTHGGFYRHFPSKEALVAESGVEAFQGTIPQLRAYTLAAPPGKRLKALIAAYVSELHRDQPESGCFGAALVSEVGRQPASVREAVDGQLDQFLAMIEEFAASDNCPIAPRALLSMMIGAVSLSRVPTDPDNSKAYLKQTVKTLYALIDSLRSTTAASGKPTA